MKGICSHGFEASVSIKTRNFLAIWIIINFSLNSSYYGMELSL